MTLREILLLNALATATRGETGCFANCGALATRTLYSRPESHAYIGEYCDEHGKSETGEEPRPNAVIARKFNALLKKAVAE